MHDNHLDLVVGQGVLQALAQHYDEGHALALVWVALLVSRYSSNTASFVVCAVYGVKDHHDLQIYSPLLKKTCVRQVVLDKWFPLIGGMRRRAGGYGGFLGDSAFKPFTNRFVIIQCIVFMLNCHCLTKNVQFTCLCCLVYMCL